MINAGPDPGFLKRGDVASSDRRPEGGVQFVTIHIIIREATHFFQISWHLRTNVITFCRTGVKYHYKNYVALQK